MKPYASSAASKLALMAYAAGLTWVLVRDGGAWLGDPLWGQETLAFAMVLALPIYLGVVAHESGWDRRELVSLFDRRQRRRVLAEALAIRLMPVLLMTLAAHAVAVGASATLPFSFANQSSWPLLTQLVAVALSVSLASAIGQALPGWGGTVLAPALWIIAYVGDRAGLVNSGLAEFTPSGSLLGYTPDPHEFARRGVWLLALMLLAALALLVDGDTRRRAAWAGVGAVFAVGVLIDGGGDGYTTAGATDHRCAGTTVQLCGPAELFPVIDEAAPRVAQAAHAVAGLGAVLPQRYFAWTAGSDTARLPWVMLINPGRPRETVAPQDFIGQVVAPRSCRVWWGAEPPAHDWYAAEALVDGYTRQALHLQVPPEYERFMAGIAKDRRSALVRDAARALSSCDPSGLPPELGLGQR